MRLPCSIALVVGLAGCFSPAPGTESGPENTVSSGPEEEFATSAPGLMGSTTDADPSNGTDTDEPGPTTGGPTPPTSESGDPGESGGPRTTGTTGTTDDATRRVFVSSERVYAVEVAGADGDCQDWADAAGLGGSWVAWVSTTDVDAIDKLNPDAGPYVLLDEASTVIAIDNADLTDGELAAPIGITEWGELWETNATVWTGTTVSGTSAAGNCDDWSALSGTPSEHGNVAQALAHCWTECGGTLACSNQSRIYCFEV